MIWCGIVCGKDYPILDINNLTSIAGMFVPEFGDEEEDVAFTPTRRSVDCGKVTEEEFNEVFTS